MCYGVVSELGEPAKDKKQNRLTRTLEGQKANTHFRGYVALAVSTEKSTYTRELETGLGGDREENMTAFSVEALKLLRDVMKGDAKL